MRILVSCDYSHGGLAEYTHYQAQELLNCGEDVLVICTVGYRVDRGAEYAVKRLYRSLDGQKKPIGKWRRLCFLIGKAWSFLIDKYRLAVEVFYSKPDFVLLSSYAEYLSPLWIWPHLVLAKFFGVIYVANLHDPIRDFVVGPKWWHRLSVKIAYWPIRIVTVHDPLPHEGIVPSDVTVVQVPHGLYELPLSNLNSVTIREGWRFPKSAVVFLAIGYIRDNKNLDLIVRALVENPEACLVAIGAVQSSTNKPLSYYQSLAEELGVADRCLFREEFVADEDLGAYLGAADFVTITYSSTFHSQSGILNVAAGARKKVLASSGEGPLKTCVRKFDLGEFVEPDSTQAVYEGMKRLCRQAKGREDLVNPDWEGYAKYASWKANIQLILNAVDKLSESKQKR